MNDPLMNLDASDLQRTVARITNEGLSPPIQEKDQETHKVALLDSSDNSKDSTETADQSKSLDQDYISRLELIYRWFDLNRQNF